MRVIIKDTRDEAGSWVSDYIINRIKAFAPTAENPFVLGLPTGSLTISIFPGKVSIFWTETLPTWRRSAMITRRR